MKKKSRILLGVFLAVLAGFVLPDRRAIPVAGAVPSDWHLKSFWFEPWGSSGVHKGIDIFAPKGRPVVASTDLLILYRGHLAKGGKVILGMGPKWRLHYFAHLDSIRTDAGFFASVGEPLGAVGDTGNAVGKQPHLHYSIVSLIPLPWHIDGSTQGYKKAFYLDPISYLANP